MHTYILQRLILAIPVMLLVALFAFGVIRLIPGDAIMLMLAETGNISEERLHSIRAEMGLDRPFVPQFLSWVVWCRGILAPPSGPASQHCWRLVKPYP